MKKGQIQQVFIYIMAILVIGFLVLFGFRMINSIIGKQCEVQQNKFISSLKDYLSSSTRWGSKNKVSLVPPCDYQTICFVESSQIGNSFFSYPADPLIQSSIRDGIEYNVFLKDINGVTAPLLFDDRISTLSNSVECIDAAGGSITFWLEGMGRDGVHLYQT